MAFADMYSELSGCVPKIPIDFCRTLVNRAWADVRRQNLWSFQLFDANWTSPNLINAGTVAATQGQNTVVFDAVAATAIIAQAFGPPTPIIQRQFRVGIGTIYNIWALQADYPAAGLLTVTLDRPYAEVSAAASAYVIEQCYYPVPMSDFLTWISIRDIINWNDLILNKTREWVDLRDPQRTMFYLPTHCVYYKTDENPTSPTFGFSMYELWGNPQYRLTYQLYGIRRGAALVSDGDVLPSAVGEDCVLELAKAKAYEWAEANKGDMPRNQGSDFRFLIEASKAEYGRLFRSYRKDDRERVDNWIGVRRQSTIWPSVMGYYSSISGTANAGQAW